MAYYLLLLTPLQASDRTLPPSAPRGALQGWAVQRLLFMNKLFLFRHIRVAWAEHSSMAFTGPAVFQIWVKKVTNVLKLKKNPKKSWLQPPFPGVSSCWENVGNVLTNRSPGEFLLSPWLEPGSGFLWEKGWADWGGKSYSTPRWDKGLNCSNFFFFF